MKRTLTICGFMLLTVLLGLGGIIQAKAPDGGNGIVKPGGDVSLAPVPVTIDYIIHNWGNIVTTVDNHGYIGGRMGMDEPSGEWPRNSGHDYIGEMMYWMGAVLPNGDTLVANTWDDFQVVTPLGTADNKILLSTDSSRYYSYDETDTVGLGMGNPANGWRVWDADSADWVYNRTYDPGSDGFYAGGPTSLQESHYRFSDAAEGSPLLGLEITHTVLQWNYCYNEDFMFVILEITNTSEIDYNEFAFGIYADIDVGGPDGTGENGRLEDVVDYDIGDNLAWTYDNVGEDPGWDDETGVMGTKYLETPDGIGMTGLRTGDWALVPDDDPGRFALIGEAAWDTPLPPTDQYYIQCTRGINLTAGKTVRVVYAIIAGEDVDDFRANAALAQNLYDNHFVGPQPPATPILSVRSSDEKVYLNWTDTSEVSVDPLSGEIDFAGYKLYRSDDRGKTWGKVDSENENTCLDVDYDRIAEYKVRAPGDPIAHSFIDKDLDNGFEYWYCLTAYDSGDTTVGVDALQSGFGVADQVSNVVSVVPGKDPAGYYDAASTVEHEYLGIDLPSEGEVLPIVFDESAMINGDYSVVFEDTQDDTYWHLINTTTGDTVLANQTQVNEDPGLFDVVNGLRVVVTNGDREPRSMHQTGFAVDGDTNLHVSDWYGPSVPAFTGDAGDIWADDIHRVTYELRYSDDSTVAPSMTAYWGDPTVFNVPFEVWNTTDNRRVSAAVYDWGSDGNYDGGDLIAVVDHPYDPLGDQVGDAFPNRYSWLLGFDAATYQPELGDVFTIEGAPMNGPDDIFSFKVDGISTANAAAALENIKVVPDPYFVAYTPEWEQGENILEFQGIPDECTIRIYTLAGDLVRTIEHDNASEGFARWDLLSSNAQQVASGVYLYHVDSPYGEHLGRFAVIK